MVQGNSDSSYTPWNLTDINWQNGVSRSESGFFVPLNSQNLRELKVGVKIRFKSGPRVITGTVNSGPYLNIYLDGKILDPGIDGYPNRFEILN